MNLEKKLKHYSEKEKNKKIIINGEAGTGKTELIADRVKYLIEEKKIHPSSILILSFTRNAVRAVQQRIRRKLSKNKADNIFFQLNITTFDKFASRLLYLGVNERNFYYYYDKNITEATKILIGINDQNDLFFDYIQNIEYVIVDEVQDLCFERAALLQALFLTLRKYKKDWGFLLLYDEFQEIFSYMEKKKKGFFPRSEVFINKIKNWTSENYKDDLEVDSLKAPIDQNPRFIDLDSKEEMQSTISLARKILSDYPEDIIKLKSIKFGFPQLEISDITELVEKIKNKDGNVCILFRSNKTALNFSLKLYQLPNAVVHHYQLENSNRIYPKWIGFCINTSVDQNLLEIKTTDPKGISLIKENFYNVWESNQLTTISIIDSKLAWRFLSYIAAKKEDSDTINLYNLRRGLLKNYTEMLLAEFGAFNSSIIISNIHKSKGREYDYVFMEDFGISQKAKTSEVQEFARLNYVGLTRCRKDFKLIIPLEKGIYVYRVAENCDKKLTFICKIHEKNTDSVLDPYSFLNPQIDLSRAKQNRIWNLNLGAQIKIIVEKEPSGLYIGKVQLLKDNENEIELGVLNQKFLKKRILPKLLKKIPNKNKYELIGPRIVAINSEILDLSITQHTLIQNYIPYQYFLLGFYLGFKILGPLYLIYN